MKLDGDSMKQWFLAHGEKVVLGVVGVIALLMVVFAFIGKESVGLNQGPEEIAKRATDAKSTLATKPAPEVTVPLPVTLPPNTFHVTPFKRDPLAPPLIPLKRVRREPQFVPASDIRAQIVRGHLGIKGGKAGEEAGTADDVKGFKGAKQAAAFRAAIVTGLVPLGLQRNHYDDAFLDTTFHEGYTGGQDAPEYYRCILERAEVQPGVTDAQLTWTAVNEADNEQTTDDVRDPVLKAEMDKWAGFIQPDLVDASLVEPWLVYPNARPMAAEGDATAPAEGEEAIDQWLPPRLVVDWERETVVHPTIAAAQDQAASAGSAKPAEETKPNVLKPATPAIDEGAEDSEKIKKFAASYGHRLLRCYDFTVEPGKKYKYRVILVLRNPNRGFDDRYLDSPKLKEGKFRLAPPSAASAVVSSPGDVQVLAGPGVAPTLRQREPGVKLQLTVLAETKDAVELAATRAAAARGPQRIRTQLKEEADALAAAWANVDKVWATTELTGARGMFLSQQGTGTTTIKHPIGGVNTDLKVIAFDTGHCLVDFLGGPKGPAPKGKDAKEPEVEPTQILLLDADGRLVIRHEAEDRATYDRQTPEAAAPPAEKPAE
jgi:hypothetical protein